MSLILSPSQRQAINPRISCWVEASAGTGKTKVLTDRVLNLLLSNAPINRILCLTFTKAAAAEMSNRLRTKLSEWTRLDDISLLQELKSLGHETPSPRLMKKARGLFTETIESSGGIRIQTIHGFCQFLLRSFPLEINLLPHFKVIDPSEVTRLRKEAFSKTLEAVGNPVIDILTKFLSLSQYEELLGDFQEKRPILQKILTRSPTDNALHIWAYFGFDKPLSQEEILKDAPLSSLDYTLFLDGSDTDQKIAATAKDFEVYKSCFLTRQGEIRKRLISKNLETKHPFLLEQIYTEAQRVQALDEHMKHQQIAEASTALLIFITHFFEFYEALKKSKALLDYDDLLLKAVDLLKDGKNKPWVLYKLEGGIDHLLVDEAQDTSQLQWVLISHLVEEFFGINTPDKSRTLFIVGDIKQSIYSFQGADPMAFTKIRNAFPLELVDLSISYRSTASILTLVDAIFSSPSFSYIPTKGPYRPHQLHRFGEAGLVELWPLIKTPQKPEPGEWDMPRAQKQEEIPRLQLAKKIAKTIREWLDTEEILKSQGRPIRPSDIMILVRRRDVFVEDLVRVLKESRVPVTGVDRMILTEQLAVQDLMVLGEWVLLPQDDLALATTLKTPLIGLSEEDIFQIAVDRKEASLWDHLKTLEPFQDTVAYLKMLLIKSKKMTPYDFYMNILTVEEGRKKILSRLGHEAEEALEEFLNTCLRYEKDHVPSLQGFLFWMKEYPVIIKRNLEQSNEDKVRIMTVHGAKGLQAPIIFLPDTTQLPSQRSKIFSREAPHPLLIWLPNSRMKTEKVEALEDFEKDIQEYYRLLYVALTRAEDRLYVCGWESQQSAKGDSWYALIENALAKIGHPFEEGWRLENSQTRAIPTPKKSDAISSEPLPSWISLPVHQKTPETYIKPSQPIESVFKIGSSNAREKGIFIHKILEWLVKASPSERSSLLKNYLIKKENPEGVREAVLSVFNHSDFNKFFSEETLTEVPLMGTVEGQKIRGIIDALTIKMDSKEVFILDYKTGSFHESYRDNPPESYVHQMALYKKVLKKIYPDYKVKSLLIWTEVGVVQEV
jgi:ATP-dependent helicase/nuclease subunit A